MYTNFFMCFIAILWLLSSSLDKVTSMYKIPCFHSKGKRWRSWQANIFPPKSMFFFPPMVIKRFCFISWINKTIATS